MLYITLNSVRQHNHFITQGNYKATCFDYRLVVLRPILSIVSQVAAHTLGSHRVYIHGIDQIKSFVSKGVTCKLCLQFARHVTKEFSGRGGKMPTKIVQGKSHKESHIRKVTEGKSHKPQFRG